jgi:hypothetical protein
MRRSVKAVPVVLLAFALTGCTTGVAATTSTTSTSPPSGVVAVDGDGSDGADLGNDRPHVTNDGLMVRRRVVIAIHPTAGANLASLRKELDTAATASDTSLSSISQSVLPPTLLAPDTPETTLVLPSGKSLADARRLVDTATSKGRRPSDVAALNVASVLVHDLQFTVSSAKPAELAADIAREGILSDALGNYTTTLGRDKLAFTYTGPLLSDELVESVRAGIARRAHIQPAAVAISARSGTGVGVDMAKEPAVAPVLTEASTAHHNHGAALPAVSAAAQSSSESSFRAVSMLALAALLILPLVLLMRRRRVDRHPVHRHPGLRSEQE